MTEKKKTFLGYELVDLSELGFNLIAVDAYISGPIRSRPGGTDNNDNIRTSSNSEVNGMDGNDIVRGRDGNDTLNGNGGNDLLFGGSGKDILDGGADNDKLFGEGGKDTLNGGAGNDVLNGGKGKGYFTGGAGNDTFVMSGRKVGSFDSVNDWLTDADMIQIDTTAGSETTLAALMSSANIGFTTGDFAKKSRKAGSSTNDKNVNDTAIYGYGADGIAGSSGDTTLGQGDDVLLMILEDWSGTLAISHFDIV